MNEYLLLQIIIEQGFAVSTDVQKILEFFLSTKN